MPHEGYDVIAWRALVLVLVACILPRTTRRVWALQKLHGEGAGGTIKLHQRNHVTLEAHGYGLCSNWVPLKLSFTRRAPCIDIRELYVTQEEVDLVRDGSYRSLESIENLQFKIVL